MEADYGVDWDGPYGYETGDGGEQVQVPEVQLPQDLTAEDMARLPDPSVPFLEAIDVYLSTVQQLRQLTAINV